MGYAIFRVERRKSCQATHAMVVHALREKPVPNALGGGARPVVVAGSTTSAEAMDRLGAAVEAAKKLKGWRKDAVHALDLLVTMSRDDGQRLSKEAQDSYFGRALRWIEARFGGAENILTATVHRDETTSHLQVVLMPLKDGRFTAASMLGGREDMSRMQDEFWQACGEPAGLLRGVKRSGAKHLPVRALYGAMAAGAEAPSFEDVPPLPTLAQRLSGQAAAIEEARRKALAANENARRTLRAQASNGRLLHPVLVSRQAERYRASVFAQDQARAHEKQAKQLLDQAKTERRQAETERREIQVQAQAAESLWTKSGAQILDRWSVHMRPEMVSHLAKQLGVDLTPGRPLLDQLRRQGRGRTMLESATIADRVLNGELHRHVQSGEAQAAVERDRR